MASSCCFRKIPRTLQRGAVGARTWRGQGQSLVKVRVLAPRDSCTPAHTHNIELLIRREAAASLSLSLSLSGRHWEAGVWVSSADSFQAGVARQRAGLNSLGIAPPRV